MSLATIAETEGSGNQKDYPSPPTISEAERILQDFKSYESPHDAINYFINKNVLPTDVLRRILEFFPNQEFKGEEYSLDFAYKQATSIKEYIPPRFTEQTDFIFKQLKVNPVDIFFGKNPGQLLTEQLIKAASIFPDVYKPTSVTLSSRALECARILTIASAVPSNYTEMESWTMQPNCQLGYVEFESSAPWISIIPEIIKSRTTNSSPMTAEELGKLQELLASQDSQFSGIDGVKRVFTLVGACDIYKEVFLPST